MKPSRRPKHLSPSGERQTPRGLYKVVTGDHDPMQLSRFRREDVSLKLKRQLIEVFSFIEIRILLSAGQMHFNSSLWT